MGLTIKSDNSDSILRLAISGSPWFGLLLSSVCSGMKDALKTIRYFTCKSRQCIHLFVGSLVLNLYEAQMIGKSEISICWSLSDSNICLRKHMSFIAVNQGQ